MNVISRLLTLLAGGMMNRYNIRTLLSLALTALIMMAFQNCGKSFQSSSNVLTFESAIRRVNFSLGNIPRGYTTSTDHYIEFSVDNSNADTYCQYLDGDSLPEPCSSPYNLPPLPDGTHGVTLIARDRDSGEDLGYQSVYWTQDTEAPSVDIADPPEDPTNSVKLTSAFMANDASSYVVQYECSINGSSFAPCSPPIDYSVTEGSNTFSIRGRDAAGNLSEVSTHNWEVDLQAPSVNLDSSPATPTTSSSSTISFSSANIDVDSFTCRVNRGNGNVDTENNCMSPFTWSMNLDGPYGITITAEDEAGNVSAAQVFTVVKNARAPIPTIDGNTPSLTTATTLDIAFSPGNDRDIVSVECQLSGEGISSPSFTDCSGMMMFDTTDVISILQHGSYTFTVRATDDTNQVGTVSHTFEVDRIAPVVTIGTETISGQDVSIPFTVDDSEAEVTCTLRNPSNAVINEVDNCASPYTFTTSVSGTHVLTVEATDPAGNLTSVQRGFTIP